MDEYVKKHLLDVLNACNEIESFFDGQPKIFEDFRKDLLRRRAVERNVEIMGEALNRILKEHPDFSLENAKNVIRTRNRVIHGYDCVDVEFLWGLVIKHIPLLKKDVENLLNQQ